MAFANQDRRIRFHGAVRSINSVAKYHGVPKFSYPNRTESFHRRLTGYAASLHRPLITAWYHIDAAAAAAVVVYVLQQWQRGGGSDGDYDGSGGNTRQHLNPQSDEHKCGLPMWK